MKQVAHKLLHQKSLTVTNRKKIEHGLHVSCRDIFFFFWLTIISYSLLSAIGREENDEASAD
jgi:hypothetical protein